MFKLSILILSIFLFDECLSQNKDTLKCWSLNDKLTWSDFNGNAPNDDQEPRMKAACPHKISARPIRENGILNYKVKLVFLKNEAWTKDTSMHLLNHEQLHFDLAELYVRKLRKAIYQIRLKEPTARNYKHIIEALISEERLKQDEFDSETEHGLFEEQQASWSKKIHAELAALKEFASTVEDCL